MAGNEALPAAVILAGGRSSRMEGGEKSLVRLAGRPMVEHVIDRLAPQAAALAINANGDIARFAMFGRPVIADTVQGLPGPLAGILAGMEWAAATGASHVVSVPTDTPFIPLDMTDRLLSAAGKGGEPVIAACGAKRHPAIGLWPVALAAQLRDVLISGENFKVSAFADRCGATTAEFPATVAGGLGIDPFFNVNTPGDLALAETMLKAGS